MNQPELIIQLQQGNPSAFRQLVDECESLVYNTALGIVQNPQDADDITQEVFIQAYQSVSSFKGESKLSTWLYRITVNRALDHEKKARRRKKFGFLHFFTGHSEAGNPEQAVLEHPGVLLENKERASELMLALKKIPDNQRVAFTLHKMEGQSYRDIAEIMGLSLQAVESLMARARTNLKKVLKDFYEKENH
ncbi:MAG: RNA polymerase sigma factor [Chitinophagaceae bacterium]|nr:RNA polymerase sigma factor [Chitinophagaceae bacterium]MBL0055054.1 RNA polymerase sigma factor [Chitinophagaceae bacterium]